jgi:hypothetical protein
MTHIIWLRNTNMMSIPFDIEGILITKNDKWQWHVFRGWSKNQWKLCTHVVRRNRITRLFAFWHFCRWRHAIASPTKVLYSCCYYCRNWFVLKMCQIVHEEVRRLFKSTRNKSGENTCISKLYIIYHEYAYLHEYPSISSRTWFLYVQPFHLGYVWGISTLWYRY